MEILKALAAALDVRVSDFLAIRNDKIVFAHGEFRKNSSLPVAQQEYIRESVEEYFSRFMSVVEILGGDVLPKAPSCHAIPLSSDSEENAERLRSHLGFAKDGPIEDLIGKLENKGFLIYERLCKEVLQIRGMAWCTGVLHAQGQLPVPGLSEGRTIHFSRRSASHHRTDAGEY